MVRKSSVWIVLAVCSVVAVATVIVPHPTRAQTGPSITLVKTVALDTGEEICGTDTELTVNAGTNVRYCYTAINDGDTTLTTHSLVDDQFGVIFADVGVELLPGAQVWVTRVHHIIETVTNTATWTATNPDAGLSASATGTVTVTVLPPSITLQKTVAIDTGTEVCGTDTTLAVAVGTAVRYCYTATNTGGYTLASHDLVDDQIGTILSNFPFSLPPGGTVFLTQVVVITGTTTNTATWTATSLRGRSASATDSVTVTVIGPVNIRVAKVVNDEVGARGLAGWHYSVAGCGTAREGVTDAAGTLLFTGLPDPIDCAYTVTEIDTEGFSVGPSQAQVVTPGSGETATVTFTNSRFAPPPPPPPTATPTRTSTPTPTPTLAPSPTETPAPTETVAGDETPGGVPTPIAPNTGTGHAEGSSIAGIVVVLLALTALAGWAMATARRP